MHYLLYSLNALLMIVVPLLVARYMARVRGASWSLFAIGAAAFVISQIGHLPFNLFVSRLVEGSIAEFSPQARLFFSAAFLGLSAGTFEGLARYVTFRYWAKDARSWGTGLMVGLGHGGGEAIILGLLTGINLIFLFGLREGHFLALVPSEQMPLLERSLDEMFRAPWYATLLGAIERVSAICLHLAASLLMLQLFVRGRIRWLFAAIGLHAMFDAVAVFAVASWGIYVTEALVAVGGLFGLLIVFRLRTPEPEEPRIVPLPQVGPVKPVDLELTQERLEGSRFL